MPKFDVLTIGNAIVDILARCDDQFLGDNAIIKGAMNLINAERAELLYSKMGPAVEASGGSAGNTAAGVASLGGRAAYFGKVANDQLGTIFQHDIRAQGVHYETKPDGVHPPTARSMIFVTPDGERSMNTYLGACVELGPEHVEEDVVAESKVTYFEGYLWDPPRAKDAIRKAADGPLKGVLGYVDEPMVSIDFNHNQNSSSFDLTQTQVIDKRLVRILSWYDNEWGFANRMGDTAVAMGKLL